jgi:hypothetical protein
MRRNPVWPLRHCRFLHLTLLIGALILSFPSAPAASTPNWGTAALIENLDTHVGVQALGADDHGNALAVWRQIDPGGYYYSIYVNQYVADQGWGDPVLVETLPGNAFYPDLVVIGEGKAIAVWKHQNGTVSDLYASRFDPDTGWGTPESIHESSGFIYDFVKVAMDATGNAFVVWLESDGSYIYSSVYASRYDAGTAQWGTPSLLENSPGSVTNLYAPNPQISMDDSGNAMAVWYQNDGVGYSIYANRYEAGLGWQTPVLLETQGGDAYSPSLLLDKNGNATVMWDHSDGSVYATRYVPGTGWGTVTQFKNSSALNNLYGPPHMALDHATGDVIAVWEMASFLYSSRFVEGSGWTAPVLIESMNGNALHPELWALYPEIATDQDGNATVVWEQYETVFNIYAVRYEPGLGWDTPVLIDNGPMSAYVPLITALNNGNMLSTWYQMEKPYGFYGLYANQFIAATNHAPIANAGPDQSLECSGIDGASSVILDGSLSSDPDGDSLSYTWTGPFGTAMGVSTGVSLPVGTHTVTLTVNDGLLTAADALDVTVFDTAPPTIANVMAAPAVLLQPNHKMRAVTVTASVSDLCDQALTCRIISVSSNEPENGLGDGDTSPDWEITGNLTVNLRAERSGRGSGRVYTITIQCYDASGNSSTKTVTVAVPHNKK